MTDNIEIFEEQDDNDDSIIQKYNKVIVLKDLSWIERLKIWFLYFGVKIKKL